MTQMNNDAEQTQVNYPGNSEAHARDVTGVGQKNDPPKEVVSPLFSRTSNADDSSIAEDEWAWMDEVLSNSYFNIAKTKATIKQRFQQQAQAHESIYKWLLGEEGDFPVSEAGKRYAWRTELRNKLNQLKKGTGA